MESHSVVERASFNEKLRPQAFESLPHNSIFEYQHMTYFKASFISLLL